MASIKQAVLALAQALGSDVTTATSIADAVQAAADAAQAGSGGSVTSADITDASTVGKAVLTAADAATARTAIGAGTSSLALGTTSSTAKAGDYAPAAASTTVSGIVKQAAAQADSTATDAAGIVTDLNALLAKLRTAGILHA